jgi:hypothetical protein
MDILILSVILPSSTILLYSVVLPQSACGRRIPPSS